MKKFELNLSSYNVTVLEPTVEVDEKTGKEVRSLKPKEQPYPLRENLSTFLRSVGVFKSAEDVAEAVSLGKRLLAHEGDSIQLDDREAEVLKKAINRVVELTAEGKANIGGEIHEECICRVVKMKEVK
jgi:ribosomal protein S10